MHPDAQATIQWMLAAAAERRRSFLTVYDLLHALTRDELGPVAELVARYGSSAAIVHAALARSR
jgi:hypothetical protein